jgi:hypothetical protein
MTTAAGVSPLVTPAEAAWRTGVGTAEELLADARTVMVGELVDLCAFDAGPARLDLRAREIESGNRGFGR